MSGSGTCPHCGQVHRSGARFCPSTGRILDQSAMAGGSGGGMPGTPGPVGGPGGAAGLPVGMTGRLPPNMMLHQRYVILEKAGQGGMAAVYKAIDTWSPGTLWAVKEMSDSGATSAEERANAIQSFHQEATLLRALSHKNLPKVIDAFTEGGKHYLVMEFVTGQTLQSLLESRQHPVSEKEVLHWADQLCDVLQYLHSQSQPIIFRDLKPSNIMVTPTGQIKLIDFGIVRFFKPGKTKDTQAIGTLGYCAPEATSGQTDARSDIYSLCVTLHQLLTLHDPATTIYNIPPVRKLNPGVSAELERVLIKGCQNQREQRWASATDLRMQLVQISTGGRQPPVYVTPAGSMVSASKPQVAAASPVAPTKIGPAYATPAPGTHGLTQRLAMMAVQLSGRQFAAILVGLVFLLVIPTVLLAPVFEDWGAEFNRIPIYTMFGILGYSALPKRGVAFLSQSLLTLALTLADQDCSRCGKLHLPGIIPGSAGNRTGCRSMADSPARGTWKGRWRKLGSRGDLDLAPGSHGDGSFLWHLV